MDSASSPIEKPIPEAQIAIFSELFPNDLETGFMLELLLAAYIKAPKFDYFFFFISDKRIHRSLK